MIKSETISTICEYDGNKELRRGPWTFEEDNLLIEYISCHGEGRWNALAKFAGLNRTGKSCRLRWLNYLKPDIKRGNLTTKDQLLILQLHSKWGNKWSKIAKYLPGRTDNEIKNYWRTRVQKQARQLKIDANSNKFLEALRMVWMPRLIEKIGQDSPTMSSSSWVETQNSPTNSTLPKQASIPLPCHVGINPDHSASNFPKNLGNLVQFGEYIEENYYYNVREFDGQDITECHVDCVDWIGEIWLRSSFWDTDELWQFGKQEEFGF